MYPPRLQPGFGGLWTFLGVAKVSEAAHLLLLRGHGNANALALAWKASLQERRLQAATVNRRLAALRSLVQLARTLGMGPLDAGSPERQSRILP